MLLHVNFLILNFKYYKRLSYYKLRNLFCILIRHYINRLYIYILRSPVGREMYSHNRLEERPGNRSQLITFYLFFSLRKRDFKTHTRTSIAVTLSKM